MIKSEKKLTIESEMAKALYKYSFGRLSLVKAQEVASKYAPVFEAESKKNEILAHKGVTWFSKEVLKIV